MQVSRLRCASVFFKYTSSEHWSDRVRLDCEQQKDDALAALQLLCKAGTTSCRLLYLAMYHSLRTHGP